MANIRTHYDNLKVARNAPASVIKAAYKALCQTYHPDKFQGSYKEAERIMKIVNASYEVLIDPVKRGIHDVWIREQEAKVKQQSEKAHFGETDKAAEQQHYQRQDKHNTPKTEEPPPSTNPNPRPHAEPSSMKFYIKPQQNDINIFAILIDILVVLILLNYVPYAVAEFGNHEYGLDDFFWSIVLFLMAGWWVLAGRSKIEPVKRPIYNVWIDEHKANQQSEKQHFGATGKATEQQHYQRQDKYNTPKTEETPPSTNPHPHDESINRKTNITPKKRKLYLITQAVIWMAILLFYVIGRLGGYLDVTTDQFFIVLLVLWGAALLGKAIEEGSQSKHFGFGDVFSVIVVVIWVIWLASLPDDKSTPPVNAVPPEPSVHQVVTATNQQLIPVFNQPEQSLPQNGANNANFRAGVAPLKIRTSSAGEGVKLSV